MINSYDIVLLPDTTLRNKAISLSRQLFAHGSYFMLKEGEVYPHLSLYMVSLEENVLKQVLEGLAKVAGAASRFNLKANTYRQHHGYIGIEYNRTSRLNEIQMEVVDVLNPLRSGLSDLQKQRSNEAIGTARDNIEKFGYELIGELFEPHITLARFTDHRDIETTHLPLVSSFNGRFHKLAILEMGEHGTCIRLIQDFDLR